MDRCLNAQESEGWGDLRRDIIATACGQEVKVFFFPNVNEVGAHLRWWAQPGCAMREHYKKGKQLNGALGA